MLQNYTTFVKKNWLQGSRIGLIFSLSFEFVVVAVLLVSKVMPS